MKTKNLYSSKDTIKGAKRQPTKQDKIFSIYISDKDLKARILKELQNNKEQIENPREKWAKIQTDTSQKKLSKCKINIQKGS